MALPEHEHETFGQRAVPHKDRRSFRRIDLSLNGRCLSTDQEDFGIESQNLSCSGAMLTGERTPPIGSDVVCYFEDLGRVAGTVVRTSATGFAVEFNVVSHKRDKLADRLTWLLNKDALELSEERLSRRHNSDADILVARRNGQELKCRVRDISLTGASFHTNGPLPVIGEVVSAGNVHGRVVRIGDGGFAVSYLRTSELPSSRRASSKPYAVSSSQHSEQQTS